MKFQAIAVAFSMIAMSSSAAFADTVCTSSTTQINQAGPVVAQPMSTVETSYVDANGMNLDRGIKNLGNDSGNGTQIYSTVGFDYGTGPNITGPVGNLGVTCGKGNLARLRNKSVGFPPNKSSKMIYDNQISGVALPAVR